jgi:hypothetical protein
MADALYLYAICRQLGPDSLERRGLRGQPLRIVSFRDLEAVVSEVGLDEFGEAGLRRHLEDLSWLEEVARGHDEVVRALTDLTATAPVRLATICLDEEGVRHRLTEWYDALRSALDRVEGRHEWSVKALARPADDETGGPGPVSPRTAATGAGTGTAYLERKKAAAARRDERALRLRAVASAVHTGLSSAAVASRELAPQDPRLSGESRPMILNGAYLVDDRSESIFMDAVETAERECPEVDLDVAGPWPPYSFATIESS